MSETPAHLQPGFDPLEHPQQVPSLDDAEIWLDQFLREAQEMEAQANAAEQALAEIEATVENRFLRLTLGAGSTVTKLTFQPSANAATAQQLTEVFAQAHAEAAAEVTRQTMRAMAIIAGPEDPSVQAIRASVPDQIDEQLMADEQRGANEQQGATADFAPDNHEGSR